MRLLPILAISLALCLTGCGRRGAPEVPPGAAQQPRVPLDPRAPDGASAPDRPFVLDPLVR